MTDDLKERLLPCPFCGGDASADGRQQFHPPLDDTTWGDGAPITEAFFCNCVKCGASNKCCGIGHRTKSCAINAWNTRAPDPRITELEGRLAAMTALHESDVENGAKLALEAINANNERAVLASRLAAAEDKLYDAQSGPWPQWAASILTCLKDFGWRFDDLIDLPEELESYLRDYPDSAVTELREQVGSLSIALAAAEAGEDALAEAAKALQVDMLVRAEIGIWKGERIQKIVGAGSTAWADFCATLAAYEARRKG